MRWALLALAAPLWGSIHRVAGQSDSSTTAHSSTTPPSSTSSSHTHPSKSTSTARGGIAPFKTKTTRSHNPLPTAAVTDTDSFSHPFNPPLPTHHPHPPDQPDKHSGPSGWTIMLEVIGSLFGLAIIAALARCFWSYRRTPRHRHARMESIMEIRRELLQNNRPRSEAYYRPPPPPYHNPPSYEVAQCSPSAPTLISSTLTPSQSHSEAQQPHHHQHFQPPPIPPPPDPHQPPPALIADLA